MDNPQTRKGNTPINVWVTPEEKKEIADRAAQCNMSLSAYCRMLGLGYQPKSRLDNLRIDDLMKLNGDQGRIGGELKWLLSSLSEVDGKVFRRRIDELLTDIYSVQQNIKKFVENFKKTGENEV
jgi:hypothetical protein